MNKPILLAVIALAATLSAPAAMAADEHNVVPGLTLEGAPLGLHGVDPVAFVELGNRIDGVASFVAVHDGVAYYFATEANRDIFKKNPERYVPQNGGFCTYGVSVGKKFDGDPRYAAVVDGKLYVFVNEDILRAFNKDRAGTIKKASKNWAKIRNIAATDL
ncbi:MAG: YHS domain-containing protein [Alphaproteobacteria bacterium]|nr:MAG: YHS domain-containing protein [Alphaproteobacteria bacterium]